MVREAPEKTGMWEVWVFRVPSACILYIEIVLFNDLASPLLSFHSQPYYFQQNKPLNGLGTLLPHGTSAPLVPSWLATPHDTWAGSPERINAMFGQMMVQPVVQLGPGVDPTPPRSGRPTARWCP
jgi:hypothetical protein